LLRGDVASENSARNNGRPFGRALLFGHTRLPTEARQHGERRITKHQFSIGLNHNRSRRRQQFREPLLHHHQRILQAHATLHRNRAEAKVATVTTDAGCVLIAPGVPAGSRCGRIQPKRGWPILWPHGFSSQLNQNPVCVSHLMAIFDVQCGHPNQDPSAGVNVTSMTDQLKQ
jgi:hypothetical protein